MSAPSTPLFVLVIGLATGAATMFGGALALRFQSARGVLLGFSSGAVIGVALFDLLPEAFELGGSHFAPLTITTVLAVGFALYLGEHEEVWGAGRRGGRRVE